MGKSTRFIRTHILSLWLKCFFCYYQFINLFCTKDLIQTLCVFRGKPGHFFQLQNNRLLHKFVKVVNWLVVSNLGWRCFSVFGRPSFSDTSVSLYFISITAWVTSVAVFMTSVHLLVASVPFLVCPSVPTSILCIDQFLSLCSFSGGLAFSKG